MQEADLLLDPLPCGGHTTASDALWAGVPLLTRRGHALPGRVAASLLNALGLTEMITENLGDYQALALRLAGDRASDGGLLDFESEPGRTVFRVLLPIASEEDVPG